MGIDLETYEQVTREFFTRCARAKAIGIPLFKVKAEDYSPPEGWELDEATGYFLPPPEQMRPRLVEC